MSVPFQADPTVTSAGVYHTTPQEDVTLAIDTAALQISDSPPTAPASEIAPVIPGGVLAPLAGLDAPGAPSGNVIPQRLRNLPPGTYRLPVTFTTGGSKRSMTTTIVSVP